MLSHLENPNPAKGEKVIGKPGKRRISVVILSGIFLLISLSLKPPELASALDTENPPGTVSGEKLENPFPLIFNIGWEILTQGEAPDFFGKMGEKLAKFKKIWNFEFFSIGTNPVTVSKVVVALLSLVLGIFIVKKTMGIFENRVLPRTRLKPNVAASIHKILYYLGILLVVLFALHLVNIPLTAFAFVGGALAIGVGFGAQTLINNFISGFIIMAEQPIRIGDLIEIEGTFATIEDIGARCTRIRTADNIHILVPNSSFLEKNIINWTLSDQMVRASVTVGTVYGSPVREAERIMIDIAKEHEKVLSQPEPFVRFAEFGDNALIFNLYFWVSMTSMADRLNIESDIRFRIDDRFREAGIVIAFPQRDVHLDTAEPLELKILDSRPENDSDKRGK